jgi:hypothetical protein
VSQADDSVSASTTLTILARHSVAVRPTASSIAEFYEVASGNAFTPRGNDYIRLAWQQPPFQGWGQEYIHSTFNVGLYDSAHAESALTVMQANGYNIVRAFLTGCCIGSLGNPNGAGLSSAYIANVADFLSRAANHGIYVILIADELPPAQGGYWAPPVAACPNFIDPSNPTSPSTNMMNLCAAGVATAGQVVHDLVQALIDQGAHLDAVFSYELRNEYYYPSNLPPLSWTTGTVATANGQVYDMSSASSRQQMMDDGLVYYTDQGGAAIKALDPTALVDVGFFWPQAPNPTRIGDPRLIEVYPAYATTTADFADLHAYPIVGELSLSQVVQNYGFTGYQQQKPVLMGEFAAQQNDYPSVSRAATVLQNWQIQSCAYFFKGWLLWTWDTESAEQSPAGQDWWALADTGEINAALAPVNRPNPCQ